VGYLVETVVFVVMMAIYGLGLFGNIIIHNEEKREWKNAEIWGLVLNFSMIAGTIYLFVS
jgi:hypothetical protein